MNKQDGANPRRINYVKHSRNSNVGKEGHNRRVRRSLRSKIKKGKYPLE